MKIETIIFDRRTATKLGLKHGIGTYEISCAVENSDESQRNWVVTHKHGGRLRVRAETTSGRIIYITQPD